jgi:tRNA threonylcarbamoyladenosine biosynthesis protein TsaB
MAEETLDKQPRAWAIAAADAKRGEIYLGARSAKGETLIPPELIALDSIAARVAVAANAHGRGVALAGTAAEMIAPLLVAAGLQPVDSFVRQPDALFVAKLAAGAAAAAAGAPAGPPPKPLYLREPDAKLPGSTP